MSSRTWLPALARLGHLLCLYMTRWDVQIREHLPPEAIAPYEALKTACEVFEAIIFPLLEEGS